MKKFSALLEGKACHLANEGDGFFDTLYGVVYKAMNEEIRKMYNDEEDNNSGARYDIAGVVFELFIKGVRVDDDILEIASTDYLKVLDDEEYTNTFSEQEKFDDVRVVAEKFREIVVDMQNNEDFSKRYDSEIEELKKMHLNYIQNNKEDF